MSGTQPLVDPDGSKRAAMVVSLEFGTHALVGQHTYRSGRPVPTIPRCPVCGKQRVLYGGTCGPCGDKEADS